MLRTLPSSSWLRFLSFSSQRSKPKCGSGEVLIRVRACALTQLDACVRRGDYCELTQLSSVPGYHLSGTIEAVGAGVTELRPGDDVVALGSISQPHGGFAEYSVQLASTVVRKPDLLAFEDAASVLSPALSAATALHYQLNSRRDDYVLLIVPPQCADTVFPTLAASVRRWLPESRTGLLIAPHALI